MLLSVVIPVYNAEGFLPACLDSLFAQALVPDEIIAVDDGSSDGSMKVLREYATRHPRLKIVTQANAGPSVARNTGLEQACGKYLAFFDADDIADPLLYQTLVAVAEQDQLDMVLCNAWYYFEGREPERLIFPNESDSPLQCGRQLLTERLSRNSLLHMVWNHLYRRELLLRHRIRFVPNITSEDVLWTTQALLAAQRVRYLARPLCRYRIRSQERRAQDAKAMARMVGMVNSTLYNLHALKDIAAQQADARTAYWLRHQAVDGALSVFHKIEKIPGAMTRRACWRKLRQDASWQVLWQTAVNPEQKRKVLTRWLKYGWRL